ncbi:MAG: hypothetical protein AB2608_19375 [Candidatus Thiodiazotropha sp.]
MTKWSLITFLTLEDQLENFEFEFSVIFSQDKALDELKGQEQENIWLMGGMLNHF